MACREDTDDYVANARDWYALAAVFLVGHFVDAEVNGSAQVGDLFLIGEVHNETVEMNHRRRRRVWPSRRVACLRLVVPDVPSAAAHCEKQENDCDAENARPFRRSRFGSRFRTVACHHETTRSNPLAERSGRSAKLKSFSSTECIAVTGV